MRNVKPRKGRYAARSLQGAGTANTLRLRNLVEKQQKIEIGQRIRELREASPHTNRSISDEVGVSERAVTGWISGRGISWDHVQAVAKLFRVDPDWLWSGREKGETPDPWDSGQLDRIEAMLTDLLGRFDVEDAERVAGEISQRDSAKSPQSEADAPEAKGH